MDWTEVKINIPTRWVDGASAIAQMVVPYGIYIEDYSDLVTEAPKIAHIDLIDEELLQKDREHAVIHIYISPEENPAEAVSFLHERLQSEGIPHEIDTESVQKEAWATAWKKYYHPIKLGQHLVICPSWEEVDCAPDEVKITLDPGMAFGTGTHHTTQLCLEQLEENIKPGCSILDMGCGSGILSIGGILLGAANATAVDIDPVAVRTCQENAAVNGVHADRYRALSGDLVRDKKLREEIGSGYDIITANIVADIIIALAPTFDGFLKDDGVLITSGIIAERHQDVVEALAKEGFYPVETVERKGWVAITLKKAGKE